MPSGSPLRSSRSAGLRRLALLLAIAAAAALSFAGVHWHGLAVARAASSAGSNPGGVTRIDLTGRVLRPQVERFGINLGNQTFYDSGQMMRNLIFRNPGFEGARYRSIVRCVEATATTCTASRPDAAWTPGFWTGAHFRTLNGSVTGTIAAMLPPSRNHPRRGMVLTFAAPAPLHAGEYLVLNKAFAGDPTAGWWTQATSGASFAAEFHDLAPGSPGHQALRILAEGPGQSATLSSYFDSTAGHTFVLLDGTYTLRFTARGLSPHAQLAVSVSRGTLPAYLQHNLTLTSHWKSYTLRFSAHEVDITPATAALRFYVAHSDVLLDDVSLEKAGPQAAANPTAFRASVVAALRQLHPGVLRYMATGAELGSTLANLLAPPFARERTGYSAWSLDDPAIPMGLGEFLTLCETVHADPWVTLPGATSDEEGRGLIEYLSGPVTSPWGKLRLLVHHPAPWTSAFGRIHLELGNETWNSGFAGESITDPHAYGQRATSFFSALRAAPGFSAGKFDLILGGQADYPVRNAQILAAASKFDTFAIAPYLMRSLSDTATPEATYAPLLAQPQAMEQTGGEVASAARLAAARHAALSVYEVNLHTTEGTASQAVLARFPASAAAGLAVADHLLRMQRDAGVRNALLFSLPQFEYRRNDGKLVPLWGTVVDMGVTNRKRPQFLTTELANLAIGNEPARETEARMEGGGPMVAIHSANGPVSLAHAQLLDAFAFRSARYHTLVLFNLDLGRAHMVELTGAQAPKIGKPVEILRLTASQPGLTNEQSAMVTIQTTHMVTLDRKVTLPALSMTVLRW
jgi:hypothetical protein